MSRCRLVVLISGSGTNLQAILDACQAGWLQAQVVAVISNRSGAYGLQRAADAGIPHQVIDHTGFADRAAFDQVLAQHICAYAPDLILLAGFMRVLTPDFVTQFAGRLLNIHPSLLPAFPGLRTHQRALEAGVTRHGASVHFVTPALDGGPVIAQAEVPVLPTDDVAQLAARVLTAEHQLYPVVVQWFVAGRLSLNGQQQVVLDGDMLHEPTPWR
ncbi:MAG: phosphoribosylglycinamide formyltransferase [Pseudomonadota bacterium]